MPPPQATAEFYNTVQRYELMLVLLGRRLWRRMRPDAMDVSWSQVGPQMAAFTSGAQLAAARAAVEYVPRVLVETGQPDNPLASIRPQSFAGRASDGRSLLGLLDGAVVRSKRSVTAGKDGGDALADGERWLEQALQTAVADAARDATAASIIARPSIGWVRMVNPPCCARCAVLAGKVYAWSEGFLRHPGCDCLHVPTTVGNADSFMASPAELVRKGLITDLTPAQRKAIDGGADLSRVLNQSRDRWRERMSADRQAAKSSGSSGYNGGGNDPAPVGTTIHDFMARLSNRVQAVDAMRSAGIAE